MGRHGIHSPFVYDFVETIVQNRRNMQVNSWQSYPGADEKYARLFNRITQYYNYRHLLWLPSDEADIAKYDVLIFPQKEPLLWLPLANKYVHLLKNNSAIFIGDIHCDATHSHEWDRVCNHPKVMMSIDLYGAGLLFFKDDFKEKQHFVLRSEK